MDVKYLQHTPIDELTFSVVDTETTGMSPGSSRVMDIGIVKVKQGQIVETWESLVDPKQIVPSWITFYTKITNEHVDGQPLYEQVHQKVKELLNESIFVAHNVAFDYAFLEMESMRLGDKFNHPKLCTVLLAKKVVTQLPNFNLDAVSEYFNISISQRHRALPDALAAAKVLINLISIAKSKYQCKTYFDLERVQRYQFAKDCDARTFPLIQ